MATVITNLLSAIPVFGHDLVELIYYKKFLVSTASSIDFNLLISENSVLPTVGTVSPYALKKGIKVRLDKSEYLSVPYQFLSFLAGLIDGDGYIQIIKTTKGFIKICLVLQLHLNDLSTLEYVHSVLKIGKITISRDHKSPNCKLIINKTDLQDIFFPLLIHHGIFFLTNNRRSQFNLAMFICEKDIKQFDLIPNYIDVPSFTILPANPSGYLYLPFFKNWVVGFTTADGSFLIKANNDACFQLKQAIHINMFDAFKLLFETCRKTGTENDRFFQLSVSSKKDIQTVINFFSFSGLHPLTGLKYIQYINWLNKLKISTRYKNLNFPD